MQESKIVAMQICADEAKLGSETRKIFVLDSS